MNNLPWAAFAKTCGSDLRPVVIDPNVAFNARSTVQGHPCKIPSTVVNDAAVPMAGWGVIDATPKDIEKWSADPRLGFGMRCRELQAITIKAATSLGQVMERDRIVRLLGKAPSIAVSREDDPTRGIVLFKAANGNARHRVETQHAEIENLNDNHFVVLAGGPLGYRWSTQIEGDLQDLVNSKHRVKTETLAKIFSSR